MADAISDRPESAMTLPLQLTGIVNPAAHRTLVSHRLSFPYIIDKLLISFPLGTDHLVEATPLLALDPSASTAAVPVGNLLLSYCSPETHVLGDDASFLFDMNLHVPQRGTWLKLHLYNGDAFLHRITAIFSLTELMET